MLSSPKAKLPVIESISGFPFLKGILIFKGFFTFPSTHLTALLAEEPAIYEFPSNLTLTFNNPVPAKGLYDYSF